jgi:dipeptidyl aminopeptidase/acylaminoacyl peptidase
MTATTMPQDIRDTAAAKDVMTLYSALFAPGLDHVYAVPEVVAEPDGQHALVSGLSFEHTLEDGPSSRIYRVDLDKGELVPFASVGSRLAQPAPSGASFAYVGQLAPEREGLIIARLDGVIEHAIDIDGVIEQIAWDAQGERLLLVVAGRGADRAGFQGGYATIFDKGGPDWLPEVSRGDEDNLWRSLWVVEVADGTARQVSRKGSNIWEASWCGAGSVAVVRSGHHSEGSWYRSTLVLIDVESGAERELYAPEDQIGLPRGAPDGARVAFVEAFCSDRGIVCGILKAVSVADRSANIPSLGSVEVSSLAWRDSEIMHFAGQDGFDTVVGDVGLDGAAARELWRTADATCGEWYPSSALLQDGSTLVVTEAYAQAPRLCRLSAEGLFVIRDFAAPCAAAIMASSGGVAPHTWSAPDGLEIQGWLVTPDKAEGPLPLVVDIHGGPVWANRNRWIGRLRTTPLLVQRGCAVLYPNPRGSSCRGQDFARRVKGDMGGADTLDFLSAIDSLVSAGKVDNARVALTGASYGGFMSSWLVTQDSRFAAAAPVSPVINWYSQHGTSQIPWFDAYFLEDSPANPTGRFYSRSPGMFVDRVRTPCLILAGALDKNTPPTQALEFHQGLLEHGQESVLVVYPKDGHSLRGYPAYLDTAARILTWFAPRLGLAASA